MALQTTTWHPDTCGCVLEYTWDDALPAEDRVHEGTRCVGCCPAHEGKTPGEADPKGHYAAITAENQHKNRTYGQLLADASMEHKKFLKTAEDGTEIYGFIEEPTFSYDQDRKLSFYHKKIPTEVIETALAKLAK